MTTPEQVQTAREWIDSLADGPYTEGTYTSLAALLAAREAAAYARGVEDARDLVRPTHVLRQLISVKGD